jgi:hypothetical protein
MAEKSAESKKVELTLSDGRKVEIKKGKGHDVLQASMLMKSQEELPSILAALLTNIDGKRIQVEELLDLDIPDYLMVMDAFGRINPLFPQGK